MKANISEQVINHIKKEGRRKDRSVESKTGCESASEELHRVEGTWLKQAAITKLKEANHGFREGLSTSKGQWLWWLLQLCQLLLLPGASSKLHLPLLFGKVLSY